MEWVNINKLNAVVGAEKYPVEVLNRLSVLEVLDTKVGVNSAW
jgi:hypothetical protein